VSAPLTGLNPNTTYNFRISATNAGGPSKGLNETFKTLANVGTPPTVLTGSTSALGSASATLNATVNPNGGEVYECRFEYGTTIAYGSSAPCTPAPGSGTSPVAVSASITGLAANTTYHFRISAVNPGGTSNGSDAEFKTPLVTATIVTTAAASSVTQTGATLNALVNPNEGNVTECKFEYGPTNTYGSSAPCSSLPGSGTSPVAVSAAVTSLSNKTTYHFRISATNAGGTSTGADQTLTAASSHVYKNGVIGGEGKKVRMIGWGTLKFTNATLGEVECHQASAGYLENPTGGRSAAGNMQGSFAYECVSESCKTLGGSAIQVSPEELPWSTEVTEVEGGAFRMRIGNRIKAAGAASLRVNCVGVTNTQFFAEDAPKVLNNGTAIGSGPTEVEFDQPGSGELEGALGGLKLSGKMKIGGYGTEELLEVRNP
jgi:hypothetical protein